MLRWYVFSPSFQRYSHSWSTDFGIYVDEHGDPCCSFGTIEWEGTTEHVAFHSPYIFLFNSCFIEIRHVETGRLVQIIPGSELRCIWNGKGVSMKPTTPSMTEPGDPQDARVYFVMNGTNSTYGPEGMRSGNIAQRVCGLIPIVPPLITVSSYPAVGGHPKEPMYNPYTSVNLFWPPSRSTNSRVHAALTGPPVNKL